jgi:hypothetical protein
MSGANFDDDVLQSVLEPSRSQDEGDSLWAVFNRVQEHMINGGIMAPSNNGKIRKLPKIKSFQRDVELNKELFEMAASYL